VCGIAGAQFAKAMSREQIDDQFRRSIEGLRAHATIARRLKQRLRQIGALAEQRSRIGRWIAKEK